jgi:hypothetical protein
MPPLDPSMGRLISATSGLSTPHLATWVWDQATVTSEHARRDLLAFARAKRIDLLFVDAAPAYDAPEGFAALAALHEAAARQGTAITLVAGEPSWALPAHHADALAQVERLACLEAQLAARGLPGSRRILIDIEPYLLPAWRSARERTAAAYDHLILALRIAAHRAGLKVWHTIPFWFREVNVLGDRLDDRVLTSSDGVVIMANRNQSSAVRILVEPVLERAAHHARPAIVAVETTSANTPEVTFFGRPGGELTAALGRLSQELRGRPAFAGLAVHSYPGWAHLDGGGAPPTSSPA